MKMKKKIFFIFLAVLLLGSAFVFPTFAAEQSGRVAWNMNQYAPEPDSPFYRVPSGLNVGNGDINYNPVPMKYWDGFDYVPNPSGSSYSVPYVTSDGYFRCLYDPDVSTHNTFVFYSDYLESVVDPSYAQGTLFALGLVLDSASYFDFGDGIDAFRANLNENFMFTAQIRSPDGYVMYFNYRYMDSFGVFYVPYGWKLTIYVTALPSCVGKMLSFKLNCSYVTTSQLSEYYETYYPYYASIEQTSDTYQYTVGEETGYELGLDEGYSNGHNDGYSLGLEDGKISGRNEKEDFSGGFGKLFFSSEEVNGERVYSGLFGGILQAYLTVANGVSIFGISLHTVVITLISLVVLGFILKYILSAIK